MSKYEMITADHVEDLVDSRCHEAALVRYADGHLKVRSTLSTGIPEVDAYEVIIYQDDLPEMDQSGMDFTNLTYGDRGVLAQQIALEEERWNPSLS